MLSSEPADSFTAARLQQVMEEGRAARDFGKFNRFRFILRADNAAQVQQRVHKLMEGLGVKDEKMHVHVISKEDLPDFFAADSKPPQPR